MAERAGRDAERAAGRDVNEPDDELFPFQDFPLLGAPSGDEDAHALATTLRACAVAEIERRGLLLRLTRLPSTVLRPVHRQRARIAVETLLSADRARLFRLADGSLVVVWRGLAAERLEQALRSLKSLFADLPAGLAERAEMINVVDLPRDNAMLLQAIEESLAAVMPRRAAPRAMPDHPLDIAALSGLEQALAQADVAHFARRRTVCSVGGDGTMRLHWEKRTLSISEVASTLVPDYNPRLDPWLFRRLTRTLDRRLLALLSHPDELRLAGPFALDMNLTSILSSYFLRFDAALPGSLRGHVVLQLDPADVLADPPTFVFARDFARARGYKLLLRDIDADLLPVFPLDSLGFDFLQLRWSDQLETLDRVTIEEAAGECERVILGGVAEKEAIAWGIQAGIGLFSGPSIHPGLKFDPNRSWIPPEIAEAKPLGPDPWANVVFDDILHPPDEGDA
jgi:hypothetical protein